jgi:hypothetical protein
MRLTDWLSRPQRIVVVIAWALALAAAGIYLTSLGGASGFGWYAYAPLAHSVAFPHTGLPGWARLIVWLALIALWALGSVWVLRPAPETERPTLP